ncbi:hypothetical protein GGR51DRAFT_571105 [Nemania sp. FL0031]|nr:hypothetical protein GGR51DRAFT_571105 [Nemania sp. FL0031]
MDRQLCQEYQTPTSDARPEGDLINTSHTSTNLQDSPSVSLNTQEEASGLSNSEVDHPNNEQVEGLLTSPTSLSISLSPSKKLPWLPYTLRRIPLCLILAFSLLLELAVLVVHIISTRNSGLVDDDGSKTIVIGSKFAPTLLAVAFGLLATILLDDVKRIEPFARMASPSGATAKESITWTGGHWWTIPSPRGKESLPLFCATLIFVLGSVGISPLSSTLLVTQVIIFERKTSLHQLDLGSLVPIQPAPLATTYFRTISNILQNVSTSAWITNDYVVLPFWPGQPGSIPLSPVLSDEAQTWSAYTTIFSVDLNCKHMEPIWNSLAMSGLMKGANDSNIIASESGCTVEFEVEAPSYYTSGGEVWSSVDNMIDRLKRTGADTFNVKIHNCSENELFIAWKEKTFSSLSPAPTNSSPISAKACQNTYYVGHSTTSVTMGQGQSIVTINETEYHSTKEPLPSTIANTAAIDNIFFDLNWTVYLDAAPFRTFYSDESPGPANLLATLHHFSHEEVVADASIAKDLQRIRKQFFAEVLHSAFELRTVANTISVPGSVITSSRRVVVVSGVAIVLEIVLLIQAILIATVFYTTRPSTRPLGLTEDPSTVVSVAKLISNNARTVNAFTSYSNGTKGDLNQPLATVQFMLAGGQISFNGKLTARNPLNKSLPNASTEQPKKPTLLPIWLLIVLFVLLSLIFATIAKLYQLSQTSGLYETIFVYNIGVSIGGDNLGRVNPASLLTTLIAVVISLWWGIFDTTLRKIQPYLALAKSPASGYRGVAISYKSSYLLWAAYRAAKRRHPVLVLVSTGAFLTQILMVAMSSLWNRAPGDLTTLLRVPKILELRNVPMVEQVQVDNRGQGDRNPFVHGLFENPSTSWMYGALTQLTLHGPDPSWSAEGWSFVPIALNVTPSQDIQDTGNSTELSILSVHVTLETPAIRARMECSSYSFTDYEPWWLTKWDLTNKTNWNTTANPKNLKFGFELGISEESFNGIWTSFFANSRRLQCCENKTADSVGLASIGGYPPIISRNTSIPETWPTNFTVKWIHGRPIEGILRAEEWSHGEGKRLLWVEKPQMTALNCQPIIETAHSRVTVDSHSGRVTSYKILEVPRAYEKAWDSPWIAYQNNLSPYRLLDEANVTVSHGVLFVTGLLGAADTTSFGTIPDPNTSPINENTRDQTFNFRQPGLNVDYMTYAMLSLVDFDHQQLLDAAVLERTANQTFSTMYQHFVNNNVSFTTGGYVYQPVGEKLPDDIGQIYTGRKREPGPANMTSGGDVITIRVSRPVELLKMSTPAAWICLVILAYLIVSCGVLAIVSREYNRMLPGPSDSIADNAALVAGSARLLQLSREESTRSIKKNDDIRAKLGWFHDAEGQERWGVELYDEHATSISTNS